MSNNQGSLGYQMVKVLKTIFQPGGSRFEDKKHHREDGVIRGIGTMQTYSADAHHFSRFIRSQWPEAKYLKQVTPGMAQAYVAELVRRERAGGYIGQVCSMIRKLDFACRKNDIFPMDGPKLLPYKAEGGPGGFHSEPRPLAYSPLEAHKIIDTIKPIDPIVARVLTLMVASGLRVTEASYLRAQDIDVANGKVNLNLIGNTNRTKGGRPRQVDFLPEHTDFMTVLRKMGEESPTGNIFHDRRSLPDRARDQVRNACQGLNITCLGTHGFRKEFAVEVYHRKRGRGAGDRQALLETSIQLGHNRADVTRQSYVSPQERKLDRS
jgi:integrase